MSDVIILGDHFAAFVSDQLARGRYRDASEVVRDGLRLLEERESQGRDSHDSIERGLRDAAAGRVHDLNAVCDELESELALASTPHSR